MSAIYDSGRGIDLAQWTRPAFEQFKRVAEEAQKLDAALGQPDCVDPDKAKLLERIEARLAAIEAKLADKPKRRVKTRRQAPKKDL